MKTIKQIKNEYLTNGFIRREACRRTGLSRNSLMRKLNHPSKLTLFEVVALKNVFNLTIDEAVNIFAPDVANHN